MQRLKHNWIALVALLVSLAAITVAVVALTQTNEVTTPTKVAANEKFSVDASGAPGQQKQTVVVPKAVAKQVAAALETGLKNQAPPGTTDAQTQQIQDAQDKIKATLPGLPTAGATAGVPGCRTEFISSYSDRHGVRPVQFWLHYTVSPNVPGWADVNSVVHLFSNPNNLASSNFVIDGEGHCAYIVPVEFKAWTQAGANPFAVSFEIIDTGKESTYLATPGMAKLRSVLHVLSGRLGIPLRRGAVSNCTPTLSGIVQHYDGGVCAGGHFDITPFPMATIVKQLSAGTHPPKKVVWVRHRQQVHLQYRKLCKHAYQRKVRAHTCAGLRARARKLDGLIKRASR